MNKDQISIYTKIDGSSTIKIAPFDVSKRYTKPHKHNKYLELVYFSKGSGFHYVDTVGYAITPSIVFLIKKDEVHHWEIDVEPKGFVIIFKEAFLNGTLDKRINQQLEQLSNEQSLKIPHDPHIDSLFEVLCKEYDSGSALQPDVVEGTLKALLAKIIGHANPGNTANTGDRLTRFQLLLEEKLKNDVTFYAEKLNTTAQNLTAQCKVRYSKTASEIIAQEIIKESKRMLRYTNATVTEIAYSFEFKDVSHFVKYFKRNTGKTPLQFRRRE
ncbi:MULTISPECIES: AraC family transcriptional regulator [Maribacter]|uniref:Helix-turn-helix transcriptional regulator n=1 Tax=Maribacter flavus TaxID=1658664 RepID=A0ABU7IJL7_9FLAO|nr:MULTISPECIES: helix-turn-helix domain-containing protein [Maribacter]MDC6405715.1 helix-turn-helix transcriptional regulator [Maribacter sp. PR66]MEE1973033.1 helix-turn-helix transcriptional regulator [Maribacter flavus]